MLRAQRRPQEDGVPMPENDVLLYIVMVVVVVAAGGTAAGLRMRRRTRSSRPLTADTVAVTCTVCERELVFNRSELEPLSPAEMALVVRARPDVLGRKLSEYVCPYCESSHCFAATKKGVAWVGANLYQPQGKSAHCFECRRTLAQPIGGTPGTPQRVADVSALAPDYGMECPFCHAVCCVACCRNTARGRVTDGSLVCPRCRRRPVDLLYFP